MPAPFEHRPLDPHSSAKGALLVVGYPTGGLVGLVATHHLVESKSLPLTGTLSAPDLPPAIVVRDGRPQPAIRVHVGPQVCGLDQKCDQLAVLISDIPLDEEHQASFAEGVIDWAQRDGISSIVAFESVPADQKDHENPRIVGAATTEECLEQLRKQGVEPLKAATLAGPAAALLAEGARRDFPVMVLFVEAHAAIPDAGASAVLLEAVDRFLLHIPIDAAPLRERAKELTALMQATAQRSGQQQDWSRMYG